MTMSISIRARRGAAALSATLLTLALGGPALGHVSIPEGEVHSGGSAVIHFRIGHGCDGATTDTVEIQLPDGVVGAQPAYIPGWTVETEMVETEPYERFGETLTERVGVVRWSGGDLPDFAFYDFAVRATFLLDPGTVVQFPVVQRCGEAELAWIEPVVEGQEEPDHPMPTLTVIEPAEDGGH
jgi:periplasmic copper chaperone A